MTAALLDHLRAAWFERLAAVDDDAAAAYGRAFLREAEAFVPEDLSDADEARAILEACADEATRAALATSAPPSDARPEARPAFVKRLAQLRAATVALLDDDVLAAPPPFRRRLAAPEHARIGRALFERYPDARRAPADRTARDPLAIVARALERAGAARVLLVGPRVGAELDVALLDGRLHWIDPVGAWITDEHLSFVVRVDDETSYFVAGAVALDG